MHEMRELKQKSHKDEEEIKILKVELAKSNKAFGGSSYKKKGDSH
jgi:hypothetical protein